MPELGPLQHHNVGEAVLLLLRQSILTGVFRSGDRLVEAKLSRELHTSRGPIREALRRLEDEGLVTTVPRRGTFVARLSREDVEEIYSLREMAESLAVRRAVARLTPAVAAELQRLTDELGRLGDQAGSAEVVRLDLAFHETLVRAAGHGRLLDLWLSMTGQLRIGMAWSRELTALKNNVATHRRILAAVLARDSGTAEQELRRHIGEAQAAVLRVMGYQRQQEG